MPSNFHMTKCSKAYIISKIGMTYIIFIYDKTTEWQEWKIFNPNDTTVFTAVLCH